MNTNETITDLFKRHCIELTIGQTDHGTFYVQAKQLIVTSMDGRRLNVVHQAEAGSPVEAIVALVEQVATIGKMHSNLVPMKPRNNR